MKDEKLISCHVLLLSTRLWIVVTAVRSNAQQQVVREIIWQFCGFLDSCLGPLVAPPLGFKARVGIFLAYAKGINKFHSQTFASIVTMSTSWQSTWGQLFFLHRIYLYIYLTILFTKNKVTPPERTFQTVWIVKLPFTNFRVITYSSRLQQNRLRLNIRSKSYWKLFDANKDEPKHETNFKSDGSAKSLSGTLAFQGRFPCVKIFKKQYHIFILIIATRTVADKSQ